MRGCEPLVSDTLPKMPSILGIVPSEVEPVILVVTNPVGPTRISQTHDLALAHSPADLR